MHCFHHVAGGIHCFHHTSSNARPSSHSNLCVASKHIKTANFLWNPLQTGAGVAGRSVNGWHLCVGLWTACNFVLICEQLTRLWWSGSSWNLLVVCEQLTKFWRSVNIAKLCGKSKKKKITSLASQSRGHHTHIKEYFFVVVCSLLFSACWCVKSCHMCGGLWTSYIYVIICEQLTPFCWWVNSWYPCDPYILSFITNSVKYSALALICNSENMVFVLFKLWPEIMLAYIFHWLRPLGRVSHRVATSVCMCVCDVTKHPLPEVVEASAWRTHS